MIPGRQEENPRLRVILGPKHGRRGLRLEVEESPEERQDTDVTSNDRLGIHFQ
jgi:hypothetical protein